MIEVTKIMFLNFVMSTGYNTDAQTIGWSFLQKSIYECTIVKENYMDRDYDGLVVHVSLNDAKAFAEWYGTKLPSLEEYWELSTNENLRDVWDWTDDGYIAGGSYLCDKTCSGFIKGSEKILSPDTSNSHIGFCVLKIN